MASSPATIWETLVNNLWLVVSNCCHSKQQTTERLSVFPISLLKGALLEKFENVSIIHKWTIFIHWMWFCKFKEKWMRPILSMVFIVPYQSWLVHTERCFRGISKLYVYGLSCIYMFIYTSYVCVQIELSMINISTQNNIIIYNIKLNVCKSQSSLWFWLHCWHCCSQMEIGHRTCKWVDQIDFFPVTSVLNIAMGAFENHEIFNQKEKKFNNKYITYHSYGLKYIYFTV